MSRASTTTRYSVVDTKDTAIERPSDENVEKMYATVLEQLLTPPHVKEQLINSQTIEQKWKLVQVHKDMFKDNKHHEQWSSKETAMLTSIEKNPDIKSISSLKVVLTSANIEVMQAFLNNRGIAILMKAIEDKITKKVFSEIDVAILFEIMLCFKLIMNNSIGMEGFLAVDGCIDTLAKCLNFRFKFFALEILEILSACCYSEASTEMVIHGMRVLARYNKEQPFACLCNALRTEDIEVKTAVVRFVNSMTIGADFDGFTSLRSDLTAQLFIETYNEVEKMVDAELNRLVELGFINHTAPSAKSEKSQSLRELFSKQKSWTKKDALDLPCLYGQKTHKLHRLDSHGLNELDELGGGGETREITVTAGRQSVRVTPVSGSMAGILATVLATKSCMGTNIRIDHKWFQLKDGVLRNCAGPEITNVYENEIPVGNIIEIRAHTTDRKVLKMSEKNNYHSFEIETNSGLVLVLSTENKLNKENWLLAIKSCRDEYIISKSAYKMVIHDLTPQHILKNANTFKKLGNDYKKFTIEQQKFSIEQCGIDVSNVKEVFKFLEKEAFASGFSSKLLNILLELMLIPSGSEGTWDTILEGMRKLKRIHLQETDFVLDDAFNEQSFIEILKWKEEESGSAYKQVNKLALSSMEYEQQVEDLTKKVVELEKRKKELTRYKIINSFKTMAAGDLEVNRLTSRMKHLETTIEDKDKELATLKAELEKLNKDHQELKSKPPTVVNVVAAAAGTISAVAASGNGANERYAKFEKMKKMLPEGAVRQKMATEGFTPEEIDNFIAGAPAGNSSAAPPTTVAPTVEAAAAPVADERYAKFERMRKMLPEGAVRQKMTSEGFTVAEIDAFFSGSTPAPVASMATPAAQAAPAVDERYAKFERMRKMLPEGPVRQKMATEGFTPAEIDAFFGAPTPTTTAAASSAPVATTSATDEKYAKYDKMKKSLPEPAVRQKMKLDGLPDAEIDAYFGVAPAAAAAAHSLAGAGKAVLAGVKKPVEESPPENMAPKPVVKPEVKLKNLFWNKLPAEAIKGTLWHQLEDFNIPKEDLKTIDENFAAKVATTALTSNASFSNKGGEPIANGAIEKAAVKLTCVLDSKRVQNLLIVMGRLRKSPEEIMNIVVDLDTTVLTPDMTATLMTILPTPEELQAVSAFNSPDGLENASKLYYHFNRVPRFNTRVECHDIAYHWHSAATITTNQLLIIKKACSELTHSQNNMQLLLSMILAIGNYINGETKNGQAYGVKLDTFQKLSALKAGNSSQGTLMHYLGQLAERHSPALMTFSESWIGIWAAAELSLRDIKNDMNGLDKQVAKMNKEFLLIKDDKVNPGVDGVLEDSRGHCTGALYRRLDSFLHEGKSKMSYLQTMCSEIESSLETIMAKYGENFRAISDEDNSKKFFTTISTFAKSLRAAMDENAKKRAAKEKAERLAAEANRKLEAKRLAAEQKNKADHGKKAVRISIETDATHSPSPPSSPNPKKSAAAHNIFDKFHSEQDESTEAVLAKFRMKLHKSARLNPADIFETKEDA